MAYITKNKFLPSFEYFDLKALLSYSIDTKNNTVKDSKKKYLKKRFFKLGRNLAKTYEITQKLNHFM